MNKKTNGYPNHKRIDMKGFTHGDLTVLNYSHSLKGSTYWKVKCKCGNKFKANGNHLRNGRFHKSCEECRNKVHDPSTPKLEDTLDLRDDRLKF